MPYCPRCGTALSSHEVAQGYKDVKQTTAFVKFKVKDRENTFILAWTTTPWTLPSNVALCMNPEVMLFDEPTSGLDLKNMIKVSENLRYLQSLGITSFIITHDFELICEVCSHIIHFDQGKIAGNYKIDESK